MNRDYKFRGQRVDTKEWVYGYYFKTPLTYEGSEIAAKDGWNFMSDGKIRHCISDRGITYEVIPETIGQFTGFPDKNGKEIYEGHKCRLPSTMHHTEIIGNIVFKEGRFLLVSDLSGTSWSIDFDIQNIEVIGESYTMESK